MIQMPRRSVTRFFIPLIDVLLLLFCIFLLMPIASEKELESSRSSAEDLSEEVDRLQTELERRLNELKKFHDLRTVQEELEKIKEELDRYRKEAKKPVEQKVKVYVIDIGAEDGKLSYYDSKNLNQKPLPIADKKAASELISKHKEEGKGRELYYYLLRPRGTGFPTGPQALDYKDWFAEVGNSLRAEKKELAP